MRAKSKRTLITFARENRRFKVALFLLALSKKESGSSPGSHLHTSLIKIGDCGASREWVCTSSGTRGPFCMSIQTREKRSMALNNAVYTMHSQWCISVSEPSNPSVCPLFAFRPLTWQKREDRIFSFSRFCLFVSGFRNFASEISGPDKSQPPGRERKERGKKKNKTKEIKRDVRE